MIHFEFNFKAFQSYVCTEGSKAFSAGIGLIIVKTRPRKTGEGSKKTNKDQKNK